MLSFQISFSGLKTSVVCVGETTTKPKPTSTPIAPNTHREMLESIDIYTLCSEELLYIAGLPPQPGHKAIFGGRTSSQ